MKKLIFAFFCLHCFFSNAQRLRFEYDAAGNQILREWCPSCSSRNSQEVLKEVSDLKDSDLEKFFPDDVISYYPNPVKEELYLKWELINENKVQSLDVLSMNGQLLKTFKDNLQQNSFVISFRDYPNGIYFLNLVYSNGDQKSIKIIKN
jgi:hypothetical protein